MKTLKPLLLAFILLCTRGLCAEDFSVQAMIGLSGASVNFGNPERDAYTLAIEEWNARGGMQGRKIVLDIQDTQTTQRQIITAFHALALKNPPVILGPTWLDGFQGVIAPARKKNILLVTPSAAIESFPQAERDWPLTFYHNSTLEAEVLVNGLKSRGLKRIGIIYEQEPFAEVMRGLMLRHAQNFTGDFGVSTGVAEFHSILSRLKIEKPEVLIILVWDERSRLALLQQLRKLLPDLLLATCHDGEGWLKDEVFSPYLPQLIYTKFQLADTSFATRFKMRFGYEPILTASNAYDAMNAVLSARAAGKNTAAEIREYILSQTFDTATFGRFKFSPDGSVPSKIEVLVHPAK